MLRARTQRRRSPGEVIPEAAQKEGHEVSNGEAGATVKQVHGMVVTLREAAPLHIGAPIPAKHSTIAWIVEHAGTLLSLYSRGSDGLTP